MVDINLYKGICRQNMLEMGSVFIPLSKVEFNLTCFDLKMKCWLYLLSSPFFLTNQSKPIKYCF